MISLEALAKPREFRLPGENARRATALALAALGLLLAMFAAWRLSSNPPGALPATSSSAENVQSGTPAAPAAPAIAAPLAIVAPPKRPDLGPILSDHANAILLPAGAGDSITRLVKRLNLRPQGKFALVGHSDAPNSDQPNLLLSDQRTTVVEALLTKAGIAEQRILIAPVASHEPLEEMSASTQLNRRVTLQVVDPAVAG